VTPDVGDPGPPVAPPGSPAVPLTARERKVLRHLGELRTAEEIAVALSMSVATVRADTRNILRKLVARDDGTSQPYLRIVPPDPVGEAAP
jgi:DNA-binding CsgD family transcriptional regulator